MIITFGSARLLFTEAQASDSDELFDCITPAVARFMAWSLPIARADHRARLEVMSNNKGDDGRSFVIRRRDDNECLGMTAVDNLEAAAPEIGLWLTESVQGCGYGTETVKAVVCWAAAYLNKTSFTYPVALDNTASRRIAEGLGGTIVGRGTGSKYDFVIYRILVSRCSNVSLHARDAAQPEDDVNRNTHA